MLAVITRACSTDTSPAACAAATCGKAGSSTAPVTVSRGPSRRAACTRAFASDGASRSTSRSTAGVFRAPNASATDRASNSDTRA